MIRVIINKVIKSIVSYSDKNLNKVTLPGIIAGRLGLSMTQGVELLPLVIVLIAAIVCLVGVVVTVVKLVYNHCNKTNEEGEDSQESDVPVMSPNAHEYETIEIEAEESKKLIGENRKDYHSESGFSDMEGK